MQFVSAILGYRKQCYYCGIAIRSVLVPAVDPNKWLMCEDFTGKPEALELHQCAQHPAEVRRAAANGGVQS